VLGVTGKTIVAVVVAVSIAGGGAVAIVRHHAADVSVVAPKPVAVAVAVAVAVPAPIPIPAPAPAPVPVPVPAPAPVPVPVPAPALAPAPVAVEAPGEAILLRDAWAALSASQPARALDLVQTDEHAHPSGPLSEERDALQVVALAKLNRLAEARAAAAAFASRYPTSVHRDLVAHAIHGDPP
jgi:hypothetical protein